MHDGGYLHCDLKPENLLVGDHLETGLLAKVNLIDFGLCRLFEDLNESLLLSSSQLGSDISDAEAEPETGNLAFASPNQVIGKSLGRRDDLISMCILLVFLH